MSSLFTPRESRGFPFVALLGANAMQRVDGGYLYDFGNTMRALSDMEERDCTRWDIVFTLQPAHSMLHGVVYQSVFSESWRVVHSAASELLNEIREHLPDMSIQGSFDLPVAKWQIASIKAKFQRLESIMKAEMQSLALYHVSSKGGFDNKTLIDNGGQLFPASIALKAPEALPDAVTGAKCMAFELWTAMGFHFHRSNEAVLRRYYDSVIGSANRPKHLTMGTMLSSMEQNHVGDVNIRAALKNITVFHRNPIAHPDHHIETGDEALSLYAAIRAAMGYMLGKLPDLPMPPAITPPSPPPLSLT